LKRKKENIQRIAMKLLKIIIPIKIITDLKFAILILGVIAFTSSLGSFIEQDETINFYLENYSKPIYGFIDSNLIIKLGLDHIYTTWWFLTLLGILSLSLIGCTIRRQFPLFKNSKEYFFKKEKNSFRILPFSIKIKNIYYLKENIIAKLQNLNFYIYQKDNIIYGYKGLIGRLSPILVHFSLLLILLGSSIGAFENFKAQEILPKGEIFHIQNPLRVGVITKIPQINTRINDFWVEYKNNRIHQFYSNLSILDNFGNEIKEQTISVNNPLRYKNVDFYQSDWNLIGIRVKNITENKILEFPLFPLNNKNKSWVTWINDNNQIKTLVFDQLQNIVFVYDDKGNFLNINNIGDFLSTNLLLIDILPSTGLLIKYDPSIILIYLGFGFLMITTCLSYLPYTQIWIFNEKTNCWIGSLTNRGKIQLEIEFENLVRYLEYFLIKTIFLKKNK
jgi:cytochrome c biogenesis protein